MDPWYDYLALPIAPAVLLVQLTAIFLPSKAWRWGLGAAAPLAILLMFIYVTSRPLDADEGANIGAGVLLLWLVVSAALLVVALVVEAVRLARGPRFADDGQTDARRSGS